MHKTTHRAIEHCRFAVLNKAILNTFKKKKNRICLFFPKRVGKNCKVEKLDYGHFGAQKDGSCIIAKEHHKRAGRA